jgi:hypothetical protein
MSRDELVVLTLNDFRRAEAEYASAEVGTDEQRAEARRLRAERDGARLRYEDAVRLSRRLVPRRAA